MFNSGIDLKQTNSKKIDQKIVEKEERIKQGNGGFPIVPKKSGKQKKECKCWEQQMDVQSSSEAL